MIINLYDLKSGKLQDLLPEFYELKNSIENSADYWHQQESVFDHTLSVMSALEKIFLENKNLKSQFDQKIGSHTKKDLLEVAGLFHDIGKKEAMVKEGEFTRCPGHEKIGVEKAEKILSRFNLSKEESQRILDIIANHSEFHYILKPDNQNFIKNLEVLKNKVANIYPELIILSYADTVNSKFKSIDPKGYKYRIDFYQKETKKL